MDKFISEHKKLSIFIILMVFFYFFVAVPFEKILDNRKSLIIKQKRLKSIISNEKIVNKNLENILKEKENLELESEKIRNQNKKYKNIGEFQEKLNLLFIENNLEIFEIGRTIFLDNKYIIPYIVYGNEKDIINFLLETDKNKNYCVMKGPFEINKEKEKIKLSFNIEIEIERIIESIKIEKRESSFLKNENEDLKLIKFKLLGNNQGIFYLENKGKLQRYYLENGKDILLNNDYYKIEIFKDKLLLKNLKTDKKIIFYLGGNSEKN